MLNTAKKREHLPVKMLLFFRRQTLLLPLRRRRKLPSGVVNGVVFRVDQLPDRHHGVAVLLHELQNGRQSLRRVQRRVVKQHDAPRLQVLRHPLENRLGVVVLPVQTVPAGNRLKPASRKGIFPIPPAYHAMR